ncbi:hypothetical protein ES703_102626 [subsurface metagenome]
MAETREYQELKEALRRAESPEARKAASEAMKRYLKVRKPGSSKPMLVSLGFKKPYPTAIKLEDIPDELAKNPAFFDFLKRVIK